GRGVGGPVRGGVPLLGWGGRRDRLLVPDRVGGRAPRGAAERGLPGGAAHARGGGGGPRAEGASRGPARDRGRPEGRGLTAGILQERRYQRGALGGTRSSWAEGL